MEHRNCESCGMPMKNIQDFGGENPKNKYCRYCTDTKGNLKSYAEKVTDFKNLLIRTNDFGERQAEKMAKESLRQFPAWENIEI